MEAGYTQLWLMPALRIYRGKSVVTLPFLTARCWVNFSDMVRVVDCHAGVLGLNPGRPKIFSPWNYLTVGSGNSVMPESASLSGRGLYSVVFCMNS